MSLYHVNPKLQYIHYESSQIFIWNSFAKVYIETSMRQVWYGHKIKPTVQ